MQSIEIAGVLEYLSKRRPVFHSEADFQHAIAWELQKALPQADVRLEKCIQISNATMHVDLILKSQDEHIAIELKYKTTKFSTKIKDEHFSLKGHGATDTGRYDFLKDICRLEAYIGIHSSATGYAILLTNDSGYWGAGRKNDANDAQFRIYEGREIVDSVAWGERAAKGSIGGRETSLTFIGRYKINWREYSQFGSRSGEQFRYVVVKVNRSLS